MTRPFERWGWGLARPWVVDFCEVSGVSACEGGSETDTSGVVS